MKPKELFLSHSSHNLLIADRIAETLKNHGVPVWYSPTNILTAQQWHDEIGKALRRCDWFMVLLSPNSVASIWVKMELIYALRHNQYDNHIMPVLIEHCDVEELSWTLDMFQMADFTNNENEAYAQILNAWGIGFDQSKAS
jgi:hypothetical protein